MIGFIGLTLRLSDSQVFVNFANIVTISSHKDVVGPAFSAVMTIGCDEPLEVQESPERILEMIQEVVG